MILAGAFVGYLPLALLGDGAAVLLAPLSAPALWPVVLWAGLMAAALPALLFLHGVRAIGPTRTSIVALVEPVAGALLAAVLLAETLGPAQIAGGVLVLVAAVLLQRGGRVVADHEAELQPEG